jgi:hypothetical protein
LTGNKVYVYKCQLRHELDQMKGIPQSECPKPKTIKEFLNLKYRSVE